MVLIGKSIQSQQQVQIMQIVHRSPPKSQGALSAPNLPFPLALHGPGRDRSSQPLHKSAGVQQFSYKPSRVKTPLKHEASRVEPRLWKNEDPVLLPPTNSPTGSRRGSELSPPRGDRDQRHFPPLSPLGHRQPSTEWLEVQRELATTRARLRQTRGEQSNALAAVAAEAEARSQAEELTDRLRSDHESALSRARAVEAEASAAREELARSNEEKAKLEELVAALREADAKRSPLEKLLAPADQAPRRAMTRSASTACVSAASPHSVAKAPPPRNGKPALSLGLERRGVRSSMKHSGPTLGRSIALGGSGASEPGSCVFHFLDAFLLRSKLADGIFDGLTSLPPFETLQSQQPEMFVERAVGFRQACRGELQAQLLVITGPMGMMATPSTAHPEEGRGASVAPSSLDRKQPGPILRALRRHLEANKQLTLLWHAPWCIPAVVEADDDSSPDDGGGAGAGTGRPSHDSSVERAAQMRKEAQTLFLGASVLVLLDPSFLNGFSTLLEAWLAMQQVTERGLRRTERGGRRVTIVPIHGASKHLSRCLRLLLSTRVASTDSVRAMLEQPSLHLQLPPQWAGAPAGPAGHGAESALEKGSQLQMLAQLEGRVGEAIASDPTHAWPAASPLSGDLQHRGGVDLAEQRRKLVELEETLEELERSHELWKTSEAEEHARDQAAGRGELEARITALASEHRQRLELASSRIGRADHPPHRLAGLHEELQRRIASERAEYERRADDEERERERRSLEAQEALDEQCTQLVEAWRVGLMVEGAWFLRWRANCARMKEKQKRKRGKAALTLKVHALQQSEAEARRQLREMEEAMASMRAAQAALRREVGEGEKARREQDGVIRLQRGFMQLRLHQVERRNRSAAERAGADEIERQMKLAMKEHERMFQQREAEYEALIHRHQLALREQVREELRGEIKKELDRKLKTREKALQAEFRAELTEELEEQFQAKVSQLSNALRAAEQKLQMLKARQQGANKKHGTK